MQMKNEQCLNLLHMTYFAFKLSLSVDMVFGIK